MLNMPATISRKAQSLGLPLTKQQIFGLHQIEGFADDILKLGKKMISVFGRVKKPCGKRRKCRLPAFSPFPTKFSCGFLVSVIKIVL